LDALRRLGVDLNGMDYDGRTALHLAGSEGKLEIIKYLSKHVEDMLVKDARLNDALDDAQRGNFTDSENYLVSMLIGLKNDSCVNYTNGLFEKGMQ
jgi:ankyrin repeat protein